MEVAFEGDGLKKLVESDRQLRRKYGAQAAGKIQLRVTQLEAVGSVQELRTLPGRWHELSGDRTGTWACTTHGGQRLVIRPQEPVPRLSDGGIDWKAVTRVVVVEVTDYH